MNKTFINYRWADTKKFAQTLHRHLTKSLGRGQVFLDTSAIGGGEVLSDKIKHELKYAGALISLIGPDWLTVRASRVRRLHDKKDLVRREIETALKRKLLLIPVLVNGASRPKSSELPAPLRPMLRNISLHAASFTVPALARTIAGRVRKDGVHLALKAKSKYVGKDRNDINEDWWEWSVQLVGPKKQIDAVSTVTYYLHETFEDGRIRQVSNRRNCFKLEEECYDGFEIRAVVEFKNRRRVTLYHDLDLK